MFLMLFHGDVRLPLLGVGLKYGLLLPVVCFTKPNKCVIAWRSLFDFVRWEASLLTCILKI